MAQRGAVATAPVAQRGEAVVSEQEEQARLLFEGKKKVKEHAFYCKRAMDSEDVKGALNCASDMLRELRSSALSPRNYYELYMKVLDELHHLDDFFFQLVTAGKKQASELYEHVQACGNVLPRLYLLITVGSTYIKTRQAPAKDILNDLVEMAKGVQHPMRGLFLRHYLAHACRDKLPDVGTDYEGHGGDVSHTIDFILANFSETNRLWVRMQNQGSSRDRKRREKERQELRILVGTNLVRLSQLEAVDVRLYAESILPRLLEQVVNCKDAIAQPYLMDCIVQVFPDEFHLATLTPFLDTCTQLHPKVNVREILQAMMRRLAQGARDAAAEEGGAAAAMAAPPEAFGAFSACSAKMVEEKKAEVAEVLRLQVALLDFALECYPGRLDYVNECLATCAAALQEREGQQQRQQGPAALVDDEADEIERLLTAPLAFSGPYALGLDDLLALDSFPGLLAYLPWAQRRAVAVMVLKAVLKAQQALDSILSLERLFAMVAPLLKDPDGDAAALAALAQQPASDKESEQVLVSKVAHLIRHDSTDELFKILGAARRHFGQGGLSRIRFTLVPLVFRALDLARKVRTLEDLRASATAAAAAAAIAAAAASSSVPPPPPSSTTTTTPPEDDDDATAEPAAEADTAATEATEEDAATANSAEEEDDARGASEDEPATEGAAEKAEADPPADPPEAPTTAMTAAAVPPAPVVHVPPAVQYSSRKVFQFVHEIVTAMAGSFPVLSLNLFLQCAQCADRCGFKAIAYEFVSQAFILYEDELPDSKAQLRALASMIGALTASQGFDDADYDALATKTTQYCAKLLKKPDQCRMVAACSHLFWPPALPDNNANGDAPPPRYRDARRVLECLQRSIKIADVCMTSSSAHIHLFVEILDHYVTHYEKQSPTVTEKLVELINAHVENMEPSEARADVEAHYRNTLARIKAKKIIAVA